MAQQQADTYPRPEFIVETGWLAEHLGDDGLKIIDCDPSEVSNQREHIPHALRLPIHPYFRNTETNVGVATAEQAQEILAGLGISSADQVVCYDSAGGTMAARVWWVLWYYGHERVAVLNGGWNAWQADGQPTQAEWDAVSTGDWTANARPERITNADSIMSELNDPDFIPFDVRGSDEWSGEKAGQSQQREGHIPGAVHTEWKQFVDFNNANRLKPAAEIETILAAQGITRDKRLVPY